MRHDEAHRGGRGEGDGDVGGVEKDGTPREGEGEREGTSPEDAGRLGPATLDADEP